MEIETITFTPYRVAPCPAHSHLSMSMPSYRLTLLFPRPSCWTFTDITGFCPSCNKPVAKTGVTDQRPIPDPGFWPVAISYVIVIYMYIHISCVCR